MIATIGFVDFFRPKQFWLDRGLSGYFGAGHITILVLMVVAICFICLFAKKVDKKVVHKILIISAIFWWAVEILKVSLYFAQADAYVASREVLPLYLCSLFVYCLPLSAFGKGIAKKIGDYSISTLCLLSGLVTSINCPALTEYPLYSFFGLHSLIYHVFMTLTGVFLLASGYVRPKISQFYLAMIPVAVLAVPAIIMNNAVNTDYMMMRYAWGAPVLDKIAAAVPQPVQIILMLIAYALCTLIVALLVHLIYFCVPCHAQKKELS